MPSHPVTARRVALAAAACLPLLVAAPTALAAPSADSQGYVDSTARCAPPAEVVVFGSTASSRVAICQDSDGDYQYRGVRVRDGARLILPAEKSTDGAFTASNDGIEYMVTSSALVISSGRQVIRDEPMLDFHGSGGSATPARTPGQSPAAATPATPTPTTPLPPPLPAEVGGGES